MSATIIQGADNQIVDLSRFAGNPHATGQALLDWPFPDGSNSVGTTIAFDKALDAFSLRAGDFGGDNDSPLVINAYDADGNFLGTDSAAWSDTQFPPLATLTIIQSGIRKIVYQSGGEFAGSTFIDDLTMVPAPDVGDLSGAFGIFPRRLTASKSVEIPISVTNQGPAAAEGSLSIAYYISTDTSLDASDLQLGTLTESIALEADQSADLSALLSIPATTEAGSYNLIAKIDSANDFDEASEDNNLVVRDLTILRLSGAEWERAFPGTASISDLDPAFGTQVTQFISAVTSAGATVDVISTLRPPERAYLMHWAWRIAETHYVADAVPHMEGVYIDWWHGDQASSEKAAAAMVAAFLIDPKLKVAPALTSNHTTGKAIDMRISWKEDTLTVIDGNGNTRIIEGGPRDGTNATLIDIGATFGVIHFLKVNKDRNHWSVDGR